jgi:cytochrome P450
MTGHDRADAASVTTRRRNARYTTLDADGPLPLDMVRAVPQIRRGPLGFLERMVARYGDLVAFPMPRGAVLLVNDPSGARRVLQDNHRGYCKQTVQYSSLAAVTGSGLLTADGEAWRRHRRIMQPAFHHGGLASIAEHARAAGERLRDRWDGAPGRVLDAEAAILCVMLEVVGATLFDADLGPMGERIVTAVDAALALVVRRAASPIPARCPTPGRYRLRRAVGVLDQACREVVRARRERGVHATDTDVLARLLLAVDADGGLTEREVRDEVVTLVIAGHETVASCLTWTLHLLAERPDVQDDLAAELSTVLGDGRRLRPPRWADLPRLPLARAVIEESLRLYPPAWVITRRAVRDDVVAGLAVPAGTMVILSPWLLHRRPDSWPDPERFEPGRFLDRAGQAPLRGDYLPFGAGPRLCIGRDLALVETVLVLATLLSGRRVERPPGERPVEVEALVTLRPRGGLRLRLAPAR